MVADLQCYAPLAKGDRRDGNCIQSAKKGEGVNFVVDERNEKKAVIIDLKRHRAIWEDFYDILLTKEREKEPRETLEEVRKRVLERR